MCLKEKHKGEAGKLKKTGQRYKHESDNTVV